MNWLPSINIEWLMAIGGILIVDLILSGDNAIIIAMASRNLAGSRRKKAVIYGTIGAVALRVSLTLVATTLLSIPYLQFIGGVALLWIAINLLAEDQCEDDACREAKSLKEAVKIILLADLVMSLDNVLALAGIAQTVPEHKYSLLIFGLSASIPLVVCGAQLLLNLIDRFPVITYAGAGVLGYAAADMIISDKAIGVYTAPYKHYIVFFITVGVLLIGRLKRHRIL